MREFQASAGDLAGEGLGDGSATASRLPPGARRLRAQFS